MSIPLLKTNLPFSHIEHANQLIHALNSAPWFETVGTGVLQGFDRVASWEEALLLADYRDDFPYGEYLQNLAMMSGYLLAERTMICTTNFGEKHTTPSTSL